MITGEETKRLKIKERKSQREEERKRGRVKETKRLRVKERRRLRDKESSPFFSRRAEGALCLDDNGLKAQRATSPLVSKAIQPGRLYCE